MTSLIQWGRGRGGHIVEGAEVGGEELTGPMGQRLERCCCCLGDCERR